MDESGKNPLTETFLNYFTVHLADTPQLREHAYRIRYRVYCDEFGYEDPARFPDRMERDEYDEQSLHCVVIHRSGIPAGCVRIVPAEGEMEHAPLPFEKHCGKAVDRQLIRTLVPDRSRLCEISRLAVDGAFRRRAGEAKTRFGEVEAMELGAEEVRTFPLIAVATFLGATAMTELSGRTHAIAMMEPFLPRLLKRSGFIFQRVGRDVEYHGRRAPYFNCTEAALKSMRPELRSLYDAIHAQVAAHFQVPLRWNTG